MKWVVCLAAVVAVACALAGPPVVQTVAPAVRPDNWTPRAGQPVALAVDVSADVVVRHRGSQWRVDPDVRGERRFTPDESGTHIVSSSIEPGEDSARPRTFQYDKLFLAVSDAAPKGSGARVSSASTMARFGARFELTSLVDPTCVPVGADLPVRVKFDGADLKHAAVTVTRAALQIKGAAASQPAALATAADGLVNVRIDRDGLWTLSVVHEAVSDPGRAADRFVATMSFVVAAPPKPASTQGARP